MSSIDFKPFTYPDNKIMSSAYANAPAKLLLA